MSGPKSAHAERTVVGPHGSPTTRQKARYVRPAASRSTTTAKHGGTSHDEGRSLMEPFVLDRDENPHPRLREHALQLRRSARASDDPIVGALWLGYTDCACDATGWNAETWNAWLDQYDDFDHDLIGHKDAATPPAVAQRVEIRR